MPDGTVSTAEPRAGLHVAIVMDGNGRWAARRGLPRLEGHRRGVEALRGVIEACPDLGVETLTIFAFSTENWRRPLDEVRGLIGLFRRYLRKDAAELAAKGVRVRFLGDSSPFPPDVRALMQGLETQTADCERYQLCVAINYGGRADIVAAARRLAEEVAAGRLSPEEIDDEAVEAVLWTAGLPDPDLVIRTSGEQRLSNFLLWQSAYSEFVFAPELWPDFDRAALERALSVFGARERRFGAVVG